MDRGRLRERPGYRSWIIEDDYDSEYRYDSMPIASLQDLDSNARVTYTACSSSGPPLTAFPHNPTLGGSDLTRVVGWLVIAWTYWAVGNLYLTHHRAS